MFHGTSGNDNMHAVAWSPDGKRLAYGGANALVYVWNKMTKKLDFVFQGHLGEIWSIAWSPDGTRIASAGVDHTVRVWRAI